METLSDWCEIRTTFPTADFWLVRKASGHRVGRPVREYSPEHIGLLARNPQQMLPGYLWYVMEVLYLKGYWLHHCHGSLSLQHIRVKDVKRLRIV